MDSLLHWLADDGTLGGLPLAFLLGALVGAEREWRQTSAASLRACVLICVAAAAFADLMVTRVDQANLGAGAIMRDGPMVRGLSTAATIWCVAAIGAQAGAGEAVGAIWLTVLVLLINTLLLPVQRLIRRKPARRAEDDVT